MENNSVSPMPELAPIAEFDKTPPSPPHEVELHHMDDLPPPPSAPAPEEPLKKRNCGSCDVTEEPWGCASWFEYTCVVALSIILLIGSLALTIFWVITYRKGFAWIDDPEREFNFHPVLMIAGFVTLMGFGVLTYRICRCCKRLVVKLIHTIFFALAIPCIVIGFIAVWDHHNNMKPAIGHFYSLHSWMGLTAMGLFALQFIMGFFTFLLLLCCQDSTANFRARMVSIHAAIGVVTFVLGLATCLTGLTQTIPAVLGETYKQWTNEGIIMNALGMVLAAIIIVVVFSLRRHNRQRCPRVSIDPSSS